MLPKYQIERAGGYGDKTWHSEETIEAENFVDAYERSVAKYGAIGVLDLVCIEEID